MYPKRSKHTPKLTAAPPSTPTKRADSCCVRSLRFLPVADVRGAERHRARLKVKKHEKIRAAGRRKEHVCSANTSLDEWPEIRARQTDCVAARRRGGEKKGDLNGRATLNVSQIAHCGTSYCK